MITTTDTTRLNALKGGTVVIKYGGNAMTEPALQDALAQDLVALSQAGIQPILVHGGGPQIDQVLHMIGHQSVFHNGLRQTDHTTLRVVQWVLAGEVQGQLVDAINRAGGRAVGLSGRDGQMALASKRKATADGTDLGFVGQITAFEPLLLQTVLHAGFIPVISSLASDAQGQIYNVNADEMCGSIARALQAQILLLMTNIAGVLGADGTVHNQLQASTIATLIEQGVIHGGMLPKIEAALAVAQSGVKAVKIVDGRIPHIAWQALAGNQPLGTTIYA